MFQIKFDQVLDELGRMKIVRLLLGLATVASMVALYFLMGRIQIATDSSYDKLLLLSSYQKDVIYYDELLTMSAKMGASTGQKVWAERYSTAAPQLDQILDKLLGEAPEVDWQKMVGQTFEANKKLLKMEAQAFSFVEKGQSKEATQILESPQYLIQKDIYNKGMKDFSHALIVRQKTLHQQIRENNRIANLFFVIITFLLFVLSMWAFRSLNKHTKKLKILNAELNDEIALREKQLADEKDLTYRSFKLLTVGEVAASIVHDISNPLTILMTKTGILIRKVEKNSALDKEILLKELQILSLTAQRISRIIKNVQFLSRPETQDEVGIISLQELMSQVLEIVTDRAHSKSVEILHSTFEDFQLEGRWTQLIQLFVNLMNNAIDACESSSRKTVELRASDSSDAVLIEVIDSGPGISEELQKKIFEPLFTTKDSSKGTGLGLTIVQRIVQNHGGHISVQSEPGKTIFRVQFPRKKS